VKLVVTEAGSEEAHAFAERAEALASSTVAYAEARAALGRSRTERRITQEEAAIAGSALDERWTHILTIDVDDAIVRIAGDIAEARALRALDAVHVASAVSLVQEGHVVFASWDRRQRAGAAAELLVLFPESV
jgi:predicted nucleic acid-binding protein